MSQDIEYEGKILNIPVEKTQQAIKDAGGKLEGDYTFRRYVFDTIPAKKGTWIRLRTNGQNTTLAVKEIQDDSIEGTSEWEVTVDDFDTTLTILQKSGLTHKGYQENRRVEFSLDGAMLTIDFWPKLEPYMEIEAKDKATVESLAERLGFNKSDIVGDNTIKLYAKQGIDLDTVADLRF
jgi:adenylate cyclase class 2